MLGVPVAWRSRDGANLLEGVLVMQGPVLCLQYQTRDWHQGAQRSTAREMRLVPGSVVHAEYRSGPLGLSPRIELQASDFSALGTLDADQSGYLTFRIRGGHRRAAKSLVADIAAAIAESRFRKWSDDLDRLAPGSAPQDPTDPTKR